MSLEVSTYVSGLDATNPTAGDKKNQGDDHLRLIKSNIKATLPGGSKPFYFPVVTTQNTNHSVLAAEDNSTILCDTSGGAITMTLPTPTDGGWLVRIVKTTTDVNPVFVAPPSGTINGLAKVRCNIPYVEYQFIWTGSAFIRLKAPGEIAPGSIEIFGGATPPVGYAAFSGQSLLRADYPELFTTWGTTWGAADGTHFSAPPSLADKFITFAGSTYALAGTGGANTSTILRTDLPNSTLAIPAGQGSHTHAPDLGTFIQNNGSLGVFATSAAGSAWVLRNLTAAQTLPAMATESINGGVAQTNLDRRPPYIAMNAMFRLC